MAFNNPPVLQPSFDELYQRVYEQLLLQEGAINDVSAQQGQANLTKSEAVQAAILAELQRTDAGSIINKLNYNRDVGFGTRNHLDALIKDLKAASVKRFEVTQAIVNDYMSRLAYGVVNSGTHTEIFRYTGSGLITKCHGQSSLGWEIIADGVLVMDGTGGSGSTQVSPVDSSNSQAVMGVPFDTGIVISAKTNNGTTAAASVYGALYS